SASASRHPGRGPDRTRRACPSPRRRSSPLRPSARPSLLPRRPSPRDRPHPKLLPPSLLPPSARPSLLPRRPSPQARLHPKLLRPSPRLRRPHRSSPTLPVPPAVSAPRRDDIARPDGDGGLRVG